MKDSDVLHRFTSLPSAAGVNEYNFNHFRTKHLLSDVIATIEKRGVAPGESAPDFVLESVDGGQIRLSEMQGKPVLLHFGSLS